MFPLPRKRRQHYVVSAYGYSCSYGSTHGVVPYTHLHRLMLEVITTRLVYNKQEGVADPHIIELGRVSEELRAIGKTRDNRYIKSATEALRVIHGMSFAISRQHSTPEYEHLQTRAVLVGDELDLCWTKGSTAREKQLYLPGSNRFVCSPAFVDWIHNQRRAVPHIREHYAQMSAQEQDIYQWLVLSLHNLHEDRLIRPEWLVTQFWGPVRPQDVRKRWLEFRKKLSDIKSRYYPDAKIRQTDEGLLLERSRPLIEPRDPRAGYTL